MATLNEIKQWFRTGKIPTQQQFWDLLDSFFYKGENIPISKIEGLGERFDEKADADAFNSLTGSLANVATSGDYDDLINKPGIQVGSVIYDPEAEQMKYWNGTEYIPFSGGVVTPPDPAGFPLTFPITLL